MGVWVREMQFLEKIVVVAQLMRLNESSTTLTSFSAKIIFYF